VKELGADDVIIYTEAKIDEEVRKLTNGKGVQVAYDSVGASTYMQSLKSLAPLGYLVLYGNSSGPVPPVDPLLLSSNGSLFMTR
jgi:NADPH:quinone reductase